MKVILLAIAGRETIRLQPPPLKPKRQISRRRRRQRRLNIVGGLAAFAIFIAVGVSLWLASRPETLRIAVDRANAPNLAAIEAISEFMSAHRRPVRLAAIVTEERSASIALLQQDRADMAVLRSDEMPADLRAALVLRKDTLTVWSGTPKKAGGGDNERLIAGTKVALFDSDPASKILLNAGLATIAERPEGFSIVVVQPVNLESTLQDKSFNYFAALTPSSETFLATAMASTNRIRNSVRMIGFDQADAIARRMRGVEAVEVTRGTVIPSPAVPSEEAATLSVAQLVVTKRSLPEQSGIAFARQMFDDRSELLPLLRGLATLEKPDTEKDAAIPVHQGVAAFLDGTERTFIERYSDLFWGAILVLSGIGSAGAWIRTWYYKDENDAQLVFRSKLLDQTRELNESMSMHALDEMDDAARTMMRQTLDAYEKGAIDEGALTAFQIAHADFLSALARRRNVVTS